MASPFSLTARGSSHRGRVRSSNQDAFLVDLGRGLLIVADGMGGHAGGEVASALCTRELSGYLESHWVRLVGAETRAHPHPSLLKLLADAVNQSSTKIISGNAFSPEGG